MLPRDPGSGCGLGACHVWARAACSPPCGCGGRLGPQEARVPPMRPGGQRLGLTPWRRRRLPEGSWCVCVRHVQTQGRRRSCLPCRGVDMPARGGVQAATGPRAPAAPAASGQVHSCPCGRAMASQEDAVLVDVRSLVIWCLNQQ